MGTQRDFNRQDLVMSLSKVNERDLATIDDMVDWAVGTQSPTVHVQAKVWSALDRAVGKATDGAISLRTHTYRGCRLVTR